VTFLNAYSTETGVVDILARMKSDRFSVAKGCFEWQSEAANYHRDQSLIVKSGDDLMSATRIAVMALRNARPAVLGSERVANRSQTGIAKGTDFDPWTGRNSPSRCQFKDCQADKVSVHYGGPCPESAYFDTLPTNN
jgi:hypothetical protein